MRYVSHFVVFSDALKKTLMSFAFQARPAGCERRSKNSAWLMTALSASTAKGFAIKKAGSGASPSRERSDRR